VTTGVDAAEPTAVDGTRIAVERDDGVVTVLRVDGTVIGRIDPGVALPKRNVLGMRASSVGLSRRHLIVLRGGRLRVYDAASLRLLRSWRLPLRATFAGIANGLVAYVVDSNVHVRRLADGRVTVVRTGGRGVKAQMAKSGLFYAVHGRPVRDYEARPFGANPARVVFVRRGALVRRFRTSR
jgi:hypothetical protein